MAFLYSLQIVFTPLAIRTTEWNHEVPYRHLFVSTADNIERTAVEISREDTG
jgi:hypothetical protein